MKSFRKACRGQKGFTLIELLVVIIILGVLAAVVTLAVTRFIGKGTLESAKAELVTVQAAIESCFADANSASFEAAVTGWTGDLANSPYCDVGDNQTVTVYEMMRTHKFKAAYDIAANGDVTGGDPTIANGWGDSIQWNATDDVWEKTPAT